MKTFMQAVLILASIFCLAVSISYANKGGKDKGSPVSKAAHEAQSQGLKGQELAGKVHEAIEQRKEGREEERGEEKGKKHKANKGRQKGGKDKGEKGANEQE